MDIGTDGSLSFIRGDDLRIPMQLLQNDNVTPLDLTGVTVNSQIRTKANGHIILTFNAEITPLTGTIVLTADHTVTEVIRAEEGSWDVQLTWGDGRIETILGPAQVTITKDITLP